MTAGNQNNIPSLNKTSKYPFEWKKDDILVKIFCSIPKISAGILITYNDNFIIIDPGDGTLRDLNNEIGYENILKIKYIFITHGHHDHLGGLWALLTYLNVMNKKDDLNIFFPNECKEIKFIFDAFQKVNPNQLSFNVILNPINNNLKTISISPEVNILPFEVIHNEIAPASFELRQVPALGFIVKIKSTSIFYSGDTSYFPGLENLVINSDFAIIESGSLNDIQDDDLFHINHNKAVEMGNLAKEYVLVHIPE